MRLSVAVTSCHSTESERPHRVANKVENIDSRKCYFSRKYLGPHLIYDSLGPSLASFKSRLVLPFWYRLTQVVLQKRSLNGCSSNYCTINYCDPEEVQSIANSTSVYITEAFTLHRSFRDIPCSQLLVQS